MSSEANKISFLGLPQELRDKVLDFVVLAERDAPQLRNLTAGGQLVEEERHEVNDIPYKSKNCGSGVFYTKDLGRLRLFPTLLVSHQLHAETLAAIDRLPTKHSYKLDIAVVNGDQLWPTWLSVPALTTRVEQVHATIRICDLRTHLFDAYDFFFEDSSWYGRPEGAWAFYDLLDRFLTVGPSTKEPRFWSDCGKTSIRTLELNVITNDASMLAEDIPTHQIFQGMFSRLLDPQFLAKFIRDEIESLLSMTRDSLLLAQCYMSKLELSNCSAMVFWTESGILRNC